MVKSSRQHVSQTVVGIKSSYFLSVRATFIPSPIRTVTQILLICPVSLLLFFNLSKMIEAKLARIKHQMVPVMVNVIPSARKGKTVFENVGSMNWGRKAIKNKATLGLRTLVITPSLYIFFRLIFSSV